MSMSAVSYLQRLREYPISPSVQMRLRPATIITTVQPPEYPEKRRRLPEQEGSQCITIGYPYPDVISKDDYLDA